MPEKVEKVEKVDTFTGKQIMESKKYKDRIDLMHALLEPDGTYTVEQVETMIKNFMKGTVK